ncbi:MAG: hypothetical protein J7K02_11130 [Deltaproteobacteria bacterium]|nr:hypothetical protein [Deltaproteobacteria bacterium]
MAQQGVKGHGEFINVSDRIHRLMLISLTKSQKTTPSPGSVSAMIQWASQRSPASWAPMRIILDEVASCRFCSMLLTYRSFLISQFAASAWSKLIDQYNTRVSVIHQLTRKTTAQMNYPAAELQGIKRHFC